MANLRQTTPSLNYPNIFIKEYREKWMQNDRLLHSDYLAKVQKVSESSLLVRFSAAISLIGIYMIANFFNSVSLQI